MTPGTIVFINGASSSGKTSLVRALQDCLDEPFLEAGLDKFIWMLPERYLERPLWDDVLGLAVTAGAQGHALVDGMHQAIAALSRSGCNVIADHVLVEPGWLRQCAGLFSDLPAYLVGVRCSLEMLEQREQGRKSRTLGQARAQYPLIHATGVYDLEVDTGRFSPQECARQIRDFLRSGAPPVALKKLRDDLSSGIAIRAAGLQDCAGLAHVQVDSYHTAYFDIFPQDYLDAFSYAEQEQDWRDFLQAGLPDTLLVAENGLGEIIGYALARPGPTNVPPYDCELVSLHVRRLYQGLGIGVQLFQASIAEMKRQGCHALLVWVLEKNPARAFYHHLGGALLEARQLSQDIAVEVAYGWKEIS